jgi:hypothetical protein
MGHYPATLAEVMDRISKYQYLGRREESEVQFALDGAQGEMELAAPALADGGLSASVDRAAWVTHIDLAILRLREEFERDPEDGSIPQSVTALRTMMDDRMKQLAAQADGGGYTVELMDAIDDVGLPT